MALSIYNSYTKKKEEFIPITPGYAGMYVCGPTVSGESHLGHARPYVTFDVLYRYLTYKGYKVRYVRNITDAGHFEEEGREAEDKVGKKAKLEKLEPMELVQKYTNLFHWAMKQFNCIEPSIEPTATGHIVEQQEMIKKIIEEGYAYEVNGSVYFDVEKYASKYDYGKLSGRILDDLLETTRQLEGQDEKRNKADFALWKAATPEHIMQWQSPWGMGFPGWHIECSAMATKYLGPYFDIHGGGMDLQFPHHESEIAQSTICNHETPVKYWMHNNMITINGRKMGKSYNNFITLTEMFSGRNDLLSKGFSPMTIRFFILQSHYRSTLDFSNEALLASEKAFLRLWDAYRIIQSLKTDENSISVAEELDNKVNNLMDEFEIFMDDDLATPKVIANMFEIVPVINSIKDKQIASGSLKAETISRLQLMFRLYLEDILGLKDPFKADNKKFGELMDLVIELRSRAKSDKDYVTSDKIREHLNKIGIVVKDEKDGSVSWTI